VSAGGKFVPDPSWPTIIELAIELWGQPNKTLSSRDEIRFGANGSKSVKPSAFVWKDHEANTGGGYLDIWKLARHGEPLPKHANGHAGNVPPWENVGQRYPYHDAAGHLVMEVIRTITGSPRFVQRRPDPSNPSGWKWSVKDIPVEQRPLYRLPQLIASNAEFIFVCEGEKDCDSLAATGLIATTNVGGAGKWRPEYSVHFTGRHVVVLPDNDPPGRDHAATVAASLAGLAASVRILGLPDLRPKGDVSDWLAAGGTRNELERLAKAPAWVPPAPEPESDEQPDPAWDQDTGPDGPENATPREPYGPPTFDDLTIEDLAAMDEVAFARIATAKALLLDMTPTALNNLVSRKRNATRAAAKAEANAAKKTAEADAKADAKAAKDAAKIAEKARKACERKARLDAQTARPLIDDEDDPLHQWTPPPLDTLPEIIVAAGERAAIADASLAAMKAGGVPFYQRGKEMVRVCLIRLKQSDGKLVRVPAISTVTKPMLLRAMGLTATWWGYNMNLDLVRIDPPGDLADHILGMIGEWGFPPLRGVTATQTLRYDGTLLIEPGYDKPTGLLLFNPPPLPDDMPLNPTKADAQDCLALLRDLLSEVAFADDAGLSRAGALSMLMTPVLRGMMPVAPFHAINKSDANAGGSYLQDLMSVIATGERCPTISLTQHNDEENEKRLSATAILAPPIIAIDNFTGTLMGNFFCQLVERPMPMVRILGKSEMVMIPNNHTVVGNGINISIGTDAIRRGVLIDLDPNMENPFERVFTRDPVAEVLADRGRYIAAVLTIARAYRLAGMPGRLPPRNSFEVWSDIVRSALVWLGERDVDESIKTARAADPHTSKLVAVMAAWAAELIVGVGYRVGELIDLASQYASASGSARAKPALWDALFSVAADKMGKLDPTRLGSWLRDHKNRVSGGHKLINDGDTARPRWKLESR